jgi:hypothetical protein
MGISFLDCKLTAFEKTISPELLVKIIKLIFNLEKVSSIKLRSLKLVLLSFTKLYAASYWDQSLAVLFIASKSSLREFMVFLSTIVAYCFSVSSAVLMKKSSVIIKKLRIREINIKAIIASVFPRNLIVFPPFLVFTSRLSDF